MFNKDAHVLTAGMRRFTLDLYHHLSNGEGNLFFSPLSIASALLLIHAGARGETRREIERALTIELPEDRLLAAYSRLDAELAERNRRYEPADEDPDFSLRKDDSIQPGNYLCRLKSSAGLWLQDGYPLEDSYLTVARETFRADQRTVDFPGDPQSAAGLINDWVREQTEGLIDRIIDPSAINPLTRLILASAVYFKAGWIQGFSEDRTRRVPFHRTIGEAVDVDMMELTTRLRYRRESDFQVIGLHYDADMNFVIILPDPGRLDAVQGSLNRDDLDDLLFDDLAAAQIRLRLPRFRIGAEIDLAEKLTGLGLGRMFGGEADLSGISAERGLHVDQFLHKGIVSVDEYGTEAAAVTAVAIAGRGLPQQEIDVTCDRPFLFFITDRFSRSILFAGRLMEPEAAD